MKTDWIGQVPLWGIFGITVVMVLVSIWVGTLMGQQRRRKPDHEEEGSLGTIISATLGLLAFMLAFTFGIASERFQMRKQLLLDEVNVISTTYLRAGLLLEPHQSAVRKLVSDYVDMRVNFTEQTMQKQNPNIDALVSHSDLLQAQMWSHAVALAMAERSSEIDALFIDSLNELINLHNSRAVVFRYRIPAMIWYVLCFITILSMVTVGYQVGLSGKKVFKISIVLALTFSAVIFLIADLDSSTQGYLQVSQRPMLELQKKMHTPTQQTGDEQAFPDSAENSGKESATK